MSLQGASDHIVSEAIYLSDPEGNGIEVYADRPKPHWRGADGLEAVQIVARTSDLQDAILSRTTAAGIPVLAEANEAVLRDPWEIAIRLAA